MPVRLVQYYYTATAAKHVMVIANVAKHVLCVPHYVNVREDALIMTIAECARVNVSIKERSKKSGYLAYKLLTKRNKSNSLDI